MAWLGIAVVVVGIGALCAIPIALVMVADRQPWPGQVRMLVAAHRTQLALGVGALSVIEALVVDVAAGVHPAWVIVTTEAGRRERLWLARTAAGTDVLLLRYWQAEAIPVLLMQDRSDAVEVHGPTGMVPVSACSDA